MKSKKTQQIKPVNWIALLNAPMPPAVRRVALAAALATAPVGGHAGAAAGGASEWTQVLNHAELMSQVSEATATTSNTLITAQTTMQQLRQLSPGTIAQMSGLPIEQVRKLAEAYTVMSRASSVYKDASDVLRKAHDDAERLDITPSELLRYKADAATKYGGIYQATYDGEVAKINAAEAIAPDLQKQAAEVEKIDANVKGLQVVATQNVKVQAALASIGGSIATANANADLAAKNAMDEKARQAMREKAALDARRKAEAEAPEVGRLRLPNEFNK